MKHIIAGLLSVACSIVFCAEPKCASDQIKTWFNTNNLSIEQHARSLRFFAQNANVVMFQHLIATENDEKRKARQDLFLCLDISQVAAFEYDNNACIEVYKNIKPDELIVTSVIRNNLNACRIAVALGGNVNAKTITNDPILCYALHNRFEDIAQALLADDRINVNCVTKLESVPLMEAFSFCSRELFYTMVKLPSTNLNIQGHNGNSVLHLVAALNAVEPLKKLLGYPFLLVNIQNLNGTTALHIAAEYNYKETVNLLLTRKDIDVERRRTNGETAYQIAQRLNHRDIMCLFTSYLQWKNKK